MEKFYFGIVHRIEKFGSKFLKRMQLLLMLIYFPVLGLVAFFFIFPNSWLLSFIFLIVFCFYCPMLYYLVKYAFLGKEFPHASGKNKNKHERILHFNESTAPAAPINNPLGFAIENDEQPGIGLNGEDSMEVRESFIHVQNLNADNYKSELQPVSRFKRFNKITQRKLLAFFNNDANKYYDVLDYDFTCLMKLLYHTTPENLKDKIVLHDDLSSNEVKEMLLQLKEITNIPMKDLSELFLKLKRKNNKLEKLNWNSIRASVSQNFKVRIRK